MKPYFIIAPPYRHNSAGVRALYKLEEELFARGCDVQMVREHGKEDAVYVLPETAERRNDNPVVWWLLNKPGHLADPDIRDGDVCFSWYLSEFPRLMVNVIETNLFRPKTPEDQRGLHAGRTVYYVGKGTKDPSVVDGSMMEITSAWPGERSHLAALLREASALISFDPFSAINLEATICGTPVTLHGDWPGESRPSPAEDFWWYMSRLPMFARTIDHFVETTQ